MFSTIIGMSVHAREVCTSNRSYLTSLCRCIRRGDWVTYLICSQDFDCKLWPYVWAK